MKNRYESLYDVVPRELANGLSQREIVSKYGFRRRYVKEEIERLNNKNGSRSMDLGGIVVSVVVFVAVFVLLEGTGASQHISDIIRSLFGS